MIQFPKNPEDREMLHRSLIMINNECPQLAEWLEKSQFQLAELNRTERDEVVFRWRQGAEQLLDDLIKSISNSKAIYEHSKKA